MSQIVLDVPNESLPALRATPEDAGARLLLAAAIKLYEMGELSSGAAASLAGLPRITFLPLNLPKDSKRPGIFPSSLNALNPWEDNPWFRGSKRGRVREILSRLADFGVDTFRLTEQELLRETRLA